MTQEEKTVKKILKSIEQDVKRIDAHIRKSSVSIKAFLILVGLTIGLGFFTSVGGPISQQLGNRDQARQENRTIPESQPELGLIYDELEIETDRGPCEKLYSLPNAASVAAQRGLSEACTHGPDPAPAGVNVAQDAPLVSNAESSSGEIFCAGDGTSGPRVQAVYAVASDKTDRFSLVEPSIRTWAADIEVYFNTSAGETGEERHVKWVSTPDCELDIERVTLSETGDDSFGNTIRDLVNQGYTNNDRKYLVWTDANVYCGIAEMYIDDRPDQDNANNRASLIARVDAGCWGYAETHELGHTLGAVQLTSPNSSGYGHCVDEYDQMCYRDSSSTELVYPCANRSDKLLDCNHDDYFHTSPPPANYLANHWNVANSRFLSNGSDENTQPDPDHSPDSTSPNVSITSHQDGEKVSDTVDIVASADDETGVASVEFMLDGGLVSRDASSPYSWSFDTTAVADGLHSISAKAFDAAGNSGLSTIEIVVENQTTPPPDPGPVDEETTSEFTGVLNNRHTSAVYSVDTGEGVLQATLDPKGNKANIWKLEIQTSSGHVMGSAVGTGSMSVNQPVQPGEYYIVVSHGKGRFTMTAHYLTPSQSSVSLDQPAESKSWLDKVLSWFGSFV